MSLKQIIAAAVQSAWPALDDLREMVIVEDHETGSYDPATGAVAPAATVSFTALGVVDAVKQGDVQRWASLSSNAGTTDVQGASTVYLLAAECAFKPTSNHSVTMRGSAWGIDGVTDHAGAVYELKLRRME